MKLIIVQSNFNLAELTPARGPAHLRGPALCTHQCPSPCLQPTEYARILGTPSSAPSSLGPVPNRGCQSSFWDSGIFLDWWDAIFFFFWPVESKSCIYLRQPAPEAPNNLGNLVFQVIGCSDSGQRKWTSYSDSICLSSYIYLRSLKMPFFDDVKVKKYI